MKYYKQLFGVVVLTFFTSTLYGQVTISPTNLFVGSDSRFGTYMVINQSNQNQEISIDFLFEYSITDNKGQRTIVHEDSALNLNSQYSIAEHIRAFPQSFVLTPNQRQVVRLRVNPPSSLSDGTYWARIRTTSSAESPPVELESDETINAQVGMNFEQITGLFYKKGDVTTGIEIEGINTDISEDNMLEVLTDFSRTGNSPFLGTITSRLVDGNGNIVATNFISTTLYFDGTQRSQLELNDISSGEYTLEVIFESKRSDVSSQDLVQMETERATKTVTIP